MKAPRQEVEDELFGLNRVQRRAAIRGAVIYLSCPACGQQVASMKQKDVQASPKASESLLAQAAERHLAACKTDQIQTFRKYAGKDPRCIGLYERK